MLTILKRVAIAILVFVLVIVVLVFVISTMRINSDYLNYDIAVESINIPTDAEAIEHGEQVANRYYCMYCHGDDFSGGFLVDMPILAVVAAPNLTSGEGGVGASNTDDDWVRAIRHGVGHDGRGLIGMPARFWYEINDEDLGDLIAYLKSLPPVDNEMPARSFGPLFRVALIMGQAPPSEAALIDHDAPRPETIEAGITVEYGEYLATACKACHGENLNGGTIRSLEGDLIISRNLTPGGALQAWTEEDFITTLRTGMTPYGAQLSDEMPWRYVGQMTDEELKAIWLYLQSLPALEQGTERTDI